MRIVLIGFDVPDVIVCWLTDSSHRFGQDLDLARLSFCTTDKAVENIFNLTLNVLPGGELVTTILDELPESADEVFSHIFEHEHHVDVASPSRLNGAVGKDCPASTAANNDE